MTTIVALGSDELDVQHLLMEYLQSNPNQNVMSVGGLCVALKLNESQRSHVVAAAVALAAQPNPVLGIWYRLYDRRLMNVQEDISQTVYVQSISEGHFIDKNGNELSRQELSDQSFPYFVATNAILHHP